MTCIIIITSTLNELPLHSFTVKALCMIAQKWCMVITLPSNKITWNSWELLDPLHGYVLSQLEGRTTLLRHSSTVHYALDMLKCKVNRRIDNEDPERA